MLSHVVLLKPRADLTDVQRRAFVDVFRTAVRDIPTVRGVRVGRRVVHGANYELMAVDTADFLAVIDFDDLAGLRTYLEHPAHNALGRCFSQSLESSLVYDFETGGIEMLDAFVTTTRAQN